MASALHEPESSAFLDHSRVRLAPVRFHHTLLDGSWWPSSADLGPELAVLVPVLDHVRGPVRRLLLSAEGWTARPHQITAAGHTVSVGYMADQAPSIMTVLCADGGIFTMRVAPPGPAPRLPDTPETGRNEDGWLAEGGVLGPMAKPAVR
jgi:Family of unknown function (DUF5994)